MTSITPHKKPITASNVDGYGVQIGLGNSTQHANTVIDTAIMVWMQMGLTESQIIAGLSVMNVESGYSPTISNHVVGDTIKGLGQFNVKTWNATVNEFNKKYSLIADENEFTPPSRAIFNQNYPDNPPQALITKTNAASGAALLT